VSICIVAFVCEVDNSHLVDLGSLSQCEILLDS